VIGFEYFLQIFWYFVKEAGADYLSRHNTLNYTELLAIHNHLTWSSAFAHDALRNDPISLPMQSNFGGEVGSEVSLTGVAHALNQ
jgi:hypothetical protein